MCPPFPRSNGRLARHASPRQGESTCRRTWAGSRRKLGAAGSKLRRQQEAPVLRPTPQTAPRPSGAAEGLDRRSEARRRCPQQARIFRGIFKSGFTTTKYILSDVILKSLTRSSTPGVKLGANAVGRRANSVGSQSEGSQAEKIKFELKGVGALEGCLRSVQHLCCRQLRNCIRSQLQELRKNAPC